MVSRRLVILGGIALALVVVLAVDLRMDDPLSSPVMAAEDPYRHMAFTREYVRTGVIEPFYDGESLYPPGVPAFLAAAWVYSGTDLYELVRFGPVFLGAVGVLGMGVLLWRQLGPIPSLVGGLGYAVGPELVFRTTMMAPTAFDLAIAPFFFFAVLEMVHGRLRWGAALAPMSLFLVYAHPWFLGLLAVSLFLFLGLCVVSIRIGSGGRSPSALGSALVIAVVGGCLGFALAGAGVYSGGLNEFLPSWLHDPAFPYLVVVASLLPVSVIMVQPRGFDRLLRPRASVSMSRTVGFVWTALVLTGALCVTVLAVHLGMPRFVDVPRMFGWPLLLLGAFGLATFPFFPDRVGLLGLAFVAITYPLLVLNVYDHEFLPHRMGAFFGIGLVVLSALAVRVVVHWTARAVVASGATPTSGVAIPLLLVTASVGGAVYATPEYSWDWYRLYDECEAEALEEVAGVLNQDADALILTGSWQAWIVLIAFTKSPSRVWVGHWWMNEYDQKHEETLKRQSAKDSPVYVLIDPHTFNEVPAHNLSFLDEEPWRLYTEECAVDGPHAQIRLYSSGVPADARI